jgi:RNA polymerase sigma-70 factor (ECF subfamily)
LHADRAGYSPLDDIIEEIAENELVAAVLRRDRKATAEFVARFADSVYSYVHWRLAAAAGDVAGDIVQEVFLEAWRGLKHYRGDGGLSSWMIGIARHKVQDHYRKALRNAEFPEEEADSTPADVPQPDNLILVKQRDDRIRAVLADLPELYRFVLLWRYWEGQKATEIARCIGRSEKAVERLLARARQQFRARYQEYL